MNNTNNEVNNNQLNNNYNMQNIQQQDNNNYNVQNIQQQDNNNIGEQQPYATTNNVINDTKETKNYIKIIIIVAVILVLILLLSFIFKSKEQNNGYTSESGELLKIEEKYQMFNIKSLSSLEKHNISNSILWDGDYIKIKVYFENPTTSDLSFGTVNFSITDSSKNDLYLASSLYTGEDSIFGKTIKSGETGEGYIYFYSSLDENTGKYTTDYSKINDSKYIKISVISDTKNKTDGISYNREDYYIELN